MLEFKIGKVYGLPGIDGDRAGFDDANGIDLVELAYSLDGGLSYQYKIMSLHIPTDGIGNGTWEITTSIDTTLLTPPVPVKYKFKAKDKLGNWTFDTLVTDFTDSINCGP